MQLEGPGPPCALGTPLPGGRGRTALAARLGCSSICYFYQPPAAAIWPSRGHRHSSCGRGCRGSLRLGGAHQAPAGPPEPPGSQSSPTGQPPAQRGPSSTRSPRPAPPALPHAAAAAARYGGAISCGDPGARHAALPPPATLCCALPPPAALSPPMPCCPMPSIPLLFSHPGDAVGSRETWAPGESVARPRACGLQAQRPPWPPLRCPASVPTDRGCTGPERVPACAPPEGMQPQGVK